MSTCAVTLTANAGLVLEWNAHTLWLDALHTGPVPGFSAVSPALWARMRSALPPPELLCFTHCHPDHYDHTLAAEALALWPSARPVLPRQDFPQQLLLSGDEVRLSGGGLTLRFLRLLHEEPYGDVPHYGLLITDGAVRLLIAGDCAVASPALTRHLEGRPVDLAILNFPWLTLGRGRRYVEEVLRPKHLLLCHLPFPEDDGNGYLEGARRAAGLSSLPDIRLLSRPLQRELIG